MRRLSPALAAAASSERFIVNAFRQERAVTIKAAKSLRDLRLNDSKVLQGMVGAAILRKAGPERYFLDEQVWASRRTLSTRTASRIAVVVVLVISAVAVYLFGK